jgi:transcriptional regulator with XRE-family HTH domain
MTQHGSNTERNADIGTRIRVARERAGLRQRELAARVDRSRYHVLRIENGRLDPDPVMIARLARALGVTFEDLSPDPVGDAPEAAAS